ncbi:MAG: M1 family metallopeptidase [Isosphaeraceae bacterium]
MSPGNSRADDASTADVHSHARPAEARVTHVDLDLTVDFGTRVLQGVATLDIERQPGAAVTLDSRGLEIQQVKALGKEGKAEVVPFTLGPADPILGSSLTVKLPEGANRIAIAYRTSKGATAVQWLDPAGTAGGRSPFLFTQSEAIHARSWIPLQDSPAVKVTYTALVRVPDGLVAVMSAEQRGKKAGAYEFEMRQPVAPYLIALAVGDLAFRPLGPRTGVWAEPSVVEAAAKEFVDTETMVEAVEKRYGPYRWGRYDLLVLPPSFPFGGMENPRLTFATPTILAGDRSLVALVAHELAHSWSGNLVTNATWGDFWLNEGFTTYIQQRVIEDLYGVARGDMERLLGYRELKEELARFAPKDQVLRIDLSGRDPDDGMTQVPYEKGALFLTLLEKTFGRDRFDAYLRGYFDRFAFKSITTADFEADLKQRLFVQDEAAAKKIDLNAWLHQPGLPTDAPVPHSDRFAAVEAAVTRWKDGAAPASLGTADWSTHEWVHFIQSLPDKLDAAKLAELDSAFGLTKRGNAEILVPWLVVAIRNEYKPADARLESLLTTVGRRKFLMPLYTELLKTPTGKARAKAIFDKAKGFYHPIAAESVSRLLAGKS